MANDLETLPRLIEKAMAALGGAATAAEVLDARDQAAVIYNAAKSAARLAKAKKAHGTILAACHRMQADALTIEARAKSRLADEYDAAQERGEVATKGKPVNVPGKNIKPTVTDIGLTRQQIHEARQIRDAEKREPEIVRKTVDAKLEAGEEPTRTDVKRAVKLLVEKTGQSQKSSKKRFDKSILDILGTCRYSDEIPIPSINSEQAGEAIEKLLKAEKALSELRVRIEQDTELVDKAAVNGDPQLGELVLAGRGAGLTVTLDEEWREALAGTEDHLGVPVSEYIDFLLRLGTNAFNRKFQSGLTNQIELWLIDMHRKYPHTFNVGSWEGSCGHLSVEKLRAKHER